MAQNQSAVALNNIAVYCLMSGDFTKASEVLRAALSQLKSHLYDGNITPITPHSQSAGWGAEYELIDDEKGDDDDDYMEYDEEEEDCTLSVYSVPIATAQPAQAQAHAHDAVGAHQQQVSSLPREESITYTMYHRALVLSTDVEEGPAYHYQATAVVLYNMALLEHSRGANDTNTQTLERALQLYEMSHEVIENVAEMFDVEQLLFAILNNTGHVYSLLARFEKAKQFFDRLRFILEASLKNDQRRTRSHHMLEEDYAVFLANTMIPTDAITLLAPAA